MTDEYIAHTAKFKSVDDIREMVRVIEDELNPMSDRAFQTLAHLAQLAAATRANLEGCVLALQQIGRKPSDTQQQSCSQASESASASFFSSSLNASDNDNAS